MTVEIYIIATMLTCVVALVWFIRKPCYRFLLPSTMSFLVWGITSVLIYSSTIGRMKTDNFSVDDYSMMIPFLFGMMVTGFIGFNIAHVVSYNVNAEVNAFNIDYIDWLLHKYKWILYICFVTGCISLVYLLTTVGYYNLGDYRIAALFVKRNSMMQWVSVLGGHACLLGFFYLSLFGYKQAVTKIEIPPLIIYVLMVGMNNIVIAGRAWITLALVPYIIGFMFGYRSRKLKFSELLQKGFIKLSLLCGIFVGMFMLIGLQRNNGTLEDDARPVDKLLYFTDGSRVTNIVMDMYPDGSFPLEYGRCQFLSKWFPSPMKNRYYSDISGDIGLTVTVTSTMPALYFDFGYVGGIIMWGVFCFVIEVICLSMLRRNHILAFFVATQLTRMMYMAPIGEFFGMSISTFEWLIILYVFHDKLFVMVKTS